MRIVFKFKKDSADKWDSIEKAMGHKYIKKIPNPSGKTKWYYIYQETFKKPLKALAEIFGIKEKKIDDDYTENNIKKDYGVDKQTFASHILEFFVNKEKWNKIFGIKENREKYEKPVKQQVLAETKIRLNPETKKTGDLKKKIINRSLMRKVWSIYNPAVAQAEQEKDSKILKKDDNIIDGGTNNGKENSIRAKRGRISDGAEDIRLGGGEEFGRENVSDTERGIDTDKSLLDISESGRRLTESDGNVNTGRGRVTKGQARKIRAQCRDILEKTDSDITEADKAILRQYVGAGGTDEEGTSNSGILYEFYTPRNLVNKVWELVDKYNPKQDKTVIEPSSGIGRFAEGRSEKFTMFELEKDSARIAHILHPDAEVVQGAFQENFLKNKKGRFTKDFEKFDVAVGNPPYGTYTGKYKGMGEGKEFKRYESYFISKTLDTLKDGGIMAMVVPSGFLDGKSTYGKDLENIAGKAELLEAWRLPNGTFDSTDIGTDIVVFKKGKGTTVDAITSYFANNPEHIAGEVDTRIGRFGEETYVKPKDGQTFETAINSIDVGKTIADEQIAKAAESVEVKKIELTAKPITHKTVFGDVVKTDKGNGIVNGYIKKIAKQPALL